MPITDEQSLRTWLEGRPPEVKFTVANFIATRAAQRAMAEWARAMDRDWAEEHDLTALPILRMNLTAGLVRKYSDYAMRERARAAARAADADASWVRALGRAGNRGAAAAANAVSSATAYATVMTAVASSMESLGFGCWDEIDTDAQLTQVTQNWDTAPLWSHHRVNWRYGSSAETRAIWAADPPGRWDFWIRWWDGILAGKPLDWDLQRDVALIPDADWQQGPDHIARVITGIEEARRPKPASALESAVLRLALTDFTFNDLRTFLRMVPFESDLSVLRDPARLARFAEDAEGLRDALGDFATMAGAGETQMGKQVGGLLSRLSAELDRAGTVGTLRVGRLIDLGAQVQNAGLNENIRIGLGDVLLPSLEIVTDRLLKLSRDYFPLALDRLEPLKQVRFLPEEDPAKIIAQLRRNLDGIRMVQDGKAVPLDPADIAVMSDVLEELERVNFAYQTTSDPAVRAELGNQLARKTAQTGVTFARYWIVARTAKDSAVKGLDWVIGWFKRYETVQKIIDALDPLWNGGSPPN